MVEYVKIKNFPKNISSYLCSLFGLCGLRTQNWNQKQNKDHFKIICFRIPKMVDLSLENAALVIEK